MSAELLIEIGTEELPPGALQRLSDAFTRGVGDGLAEAERGTEHPGARIEGMQRQQRRADAVMGQQLAAMSGVLGGNQRNTPEGVERARSDVLQITDRGRDHI